MTSNLGAGPLAPAEAARCEVRFEPADPPRDGRLVFRPVGEQAGTRLAVGDALGLLGRVRRLPGPHPTAAYWAAATVLGLQLVARGKILPGVSPAGFDAWRAGPLDADDLDRIQAAAEAMPPGSGQLPAPKPGAGRPGAGRPEAGADREEGANALLRAFLDAVADTLPRSSGGPPSVFATPAPRRVPELRPWAEEGAVGLDAGVRLSLRLELRDPPRPAPGDAEDDDQESGEFRLVLQVHDVADASTVVDAAALWDRLTEPGPAAWVAPGARPVWRGAPERRAGATVDTLVALRRAVHVWPPLSRLLDRRVPDALDLDDDEVRDLLAGAAVRLAGAGIEVHWPKDLAFGLTTRASVGRTQDTTGMPALFRAEELLHVDWEFVLGDEPLTATEVNALAEARRPVVRLRDRWVLIAPELAGRARKRSAGTLTAGAALGAALTGTVEVDGEQLPAVGTGWLETLRARLARPEAPDSAEKVGPPPGLAAGLRDYQLRGMRWLVRMASLGLGGCLADDMGLGKTVTLIAVHLHRQSDPATAGPTLVVCPASLLGNWEREIRRFAPGAAVYRYHGPGRSLAGLPPAGPDGRFVLTTYATLRLDTAQLAGERWGLVVADEAQHVKNAASGAARALRRIPAPARIALTGTPVENSLTELWAILDWTTPGLLGGRSAFRRRWAGVLAGSAAVQATDGGLAVDPETAERLARLIGPFVLRRRKSDPGIAPELPGKTETDHPVALTPEQVGLYEACVREALASIADRSGLERRGRILALLTALKQICNHPAQYLREPLDDRTALTGRSGKLELLDELLDTILAEDGSVLVFTQYVAMARLLEHHLRRRGTPALLLHGGLPVRRREELVERFQAGAAPVFLLSLKAAGTGLNLTRADHVVHFDRWWNPAVEEQATDRAYRIGQTRPVQVHRMLAEGTVEDRVATLLAAKRALAGAVLGDDGRPDEPGPPGELTELTDAELADLVQLAGVQPAGDQPAGDR